MRTVLSPIAALLLGVAILVMGNGLQQTLLPGGGSTVAVPAGSEELQRHRPAGAIRLPGWKGAIGQQRSRRQLWPIA